MKCLAESRQAARGDLKKECALKNPPKALWTNSRSQIYAMALCRDAVLIAEGIPVETNPGLATQKTRFSEWRLTALSRDTGIEIWHILLPAEPLYEGLAIDRHGRAIIAFSDGSVACYGQ